MIKILKKQWFVVLIAIIFIGFAVFCVYDTNKDKLPGKSVDGQDIVAGLKDNENITADELYESLNKTYGKNMLFMKFQTAVINQSVETTDELKEEAETYETNFTAYMESQASSYGTDVNTLITQQIAQYGYEEDELMSDPYSRDLDDSILDIKPDGISILPNSFPNDFNSVGKIFNNFDPQ